MPGKQIVADMNVIVMHSKDNVATTLRDLAVGEAVNFDDGGKSRSICVNEQIPFGHKVAITNIAPDQHVVKYGEVIGVATQWIATGNHVHVHNVSGLRGRGDRA
ncbi:MAG: UxaA family hydrolase [Bacilli bacterium]